MPPHPNEKVVVHVVDDDASMRGALEALFDSVGLVTQTYAAARDFLATLHRGRLRLGLRPKRPPRGEGRRPERALVLDVALSRRA